MECPGSRHSAIIPAGNPDFMSTAAYLGIDIGTSGIRACVIDNNKTTIAEHRIALSFSPPEDGKNEQPATDWLPALDKLLSAVSEKLTAKNNTLKITAIAIDGTSGTLIACSKDGSALSPALMYNDSRSQSQAQYIKQHAPAETAVHGASSSLAKALNLLQHYPDTEILCHQADWLAATLTGKYGISDENNCLKLGYNSILRQWPDWLTKLLPEKVLPRVLAAG